MRNHSLCLIVAFVLPILSVFAETPPPQTVRTIPTFTNSFVTNGKQYSYTVAGQKPEAGGTTTIPAVVVPLSLSFEAGGGRNGQKVVMNVEDELPAILHSPIFESHTFGTGNTQYGDAVQRAQFYKAAKAGWHTLLGPPQLAPPIRIDVPAANGYILHSKRTGKSLAIVDLDFVQKQLLQHLASSVAEPDKLVIALTKNVAFYSLGD
jgi:chitinase